MRRGTSHRTGRLKAVSAPEATEDQPVQTGDPPVVEDGVFRDTGVERSTGTPTSLTLTGAVSVGVVMVSGPPEAWLFTQGALKHVSVAGDGTVWGVNSADQIFRRDDGAWTPIPGALKQVSAGDANQIWGVNSSDAIFQWNGSSWTRVSGALKHVSVAGDGTVWGVNSADQIFRRDGGAWTRIPGALKQVSAGSANQIWGVNSADAIFQWTGSSWTRVSGALKHVSVAGDGTVWGVNSADQIFRRDGSAWTRIPGALKQVSAGSANQIWGVNTSDAIYRRSQGTELVFSEAEKATITAEVLEGLAFLGAAGSAANLSFVYDWRDITVTSTTGSSDGYEELEAPWRDAALSRMGFPASRQGSKDYVNALRTGNRTDWAYVAYITKYPLHWFAYAGQERLVMHYANDGWGPNQINQVFAHETCHIFGAADEYGSCSCDASGMSGTPNLNCVNCTSMQIPCLMNQNTLSLCLWSRAQIGWSPWTRVSGALKHVSVAGDGTVWGVNSADQIFRRDGGAWTRIPGALKQVSAGGANQIWGVNSADAIFQWNGSSWTRVSGALKHVSVAGDGTVWGVNSADQIFRRDGGAWTRISGALKQVSAGSANQIWGVELADAIFQWNGSSWTRVSGALKHVSVAGDGDGVGGQFRRPDLPPRRRCLDPHPGCLETGLCWQRQPDIWGVNSSDAIYRLP